MHNIQVFISSIFYLFTFILFFAGFFYPSTYVLIPTGILAEFTEFYRFVRILLPPFR